MAPCGPQRGCAFFPNCRAWTSGRSVPFLFRSLCTQPATAGNMKVHEVTGDYGIDALSITERKLPSPSSHQVLVRLEAVSLNYRDLLIIKGVGRWRPPAGRVPLSDGVGTIVETGSHVQNLTLNDRVAGLFFPNWKEGAVTSEKTRDPLGGPTRDRVLQEYVVFDEDQVVKVPS
jgi:NADPH:quinone reductase-like Zn-dependent oxidoreductase